MPASRLNEGLLADLLGVWRRTVKEIVMEERRVSPDMARRLAQFFNTTTELWLRLQVEVDFWEQPIEGNTYSGDLS